MSELGTRTVFCAAQSVLTGLPRHPFVAVPTGSCYICTLHHRWSASRTVCQEVLDNLVEGRVVLAADGLRGWLAASAEDP
jgi:hypothetical protein